jgi:hypothetical protein
MRSPAPSSFVGGGGVGDGGAGDEVVGVVEAGAALVATATVPEALAVAMNRAVLRAIQAVRSMSIAVSPSTSFADSPASEP